MHRKEDIKAYWAAFKPYFNKSLPITGEVPELDPMVREFVSEFEVLAVDISFGFTAESYIRATQKSLIINSFELSKNYIKDFRKTKSSPNVGKNFETLYIRMAFGSGSFVSKIAEFVLHNPLFFLTRILFRLKYNIVAIFYGLPLDILDADTKNVVSAINHFHRWFYRPILLVGGVVALYLLGVRDVWSLWPVFLIV